MKERLRLFDLINLPFELYLHKHHVSLASSSSGNQKVAKFSNGIFPEKGWTILHEKGSFLLDMDFFIKEIANLTSNFT
jgi:hypothetical protein